MNAPDNFATNMGEPRVRDKRNKKRVELSTFALKSMALTAMLMDHLEGSFPAAFPSAFGWIGRIAIPVFMFCLVQGLEHTRNMRKYLLRLYSGSALMAVGTFLLQVLFGTKIMIADNIFAMFFLLGLIIALAKSSLATGKKALWWSGFVLTQIASFLLVKRFETLFRPLADLANGLVPNVLTSEGSVIFLVLGILMYVFRKNRLKFSMMYAAFSLLMLAGAAFGGFKAQNLFYQNYQWMMLLALPLILAYNGKRGRSLKYFFYAFYPLHIWVLFVIANIVQR